MDESIATNRGRMRFMTSRLKASLPVGTCQARLKSVWGDRKEGNLVAGKGFEPLTFGL